MIEKKRILRLLNLWTATALFSFSIFDASAQRIDLSIDPPFRLKNIQTFEAKDAFGERWSVGGEGDLVVISSKGRKEQTISRVDLKSIFFVNNQTAFVVGSAGEILLTTNRGKAWKKRESGTNIDLESVHCIDESNCWIVGGGEGLLLTGGVDRKWTSENIVPKGNFRDIFFADRDTGYAVGWEGLVLKTENGGKSWTRISIPSRLMVSKFMSGIPNFESVVFKDVNNGCIAGWSVGSNVVSCTEDGGDTWHTTNINSRPVGLIWNAKDEIFLIDRNSKNLISLDFGRTWNDQRPSNISLTIAKP